MTHLEAAAGQPTRSKATRVLSPGLGQVENLRPTDLTPWRALKRPPHLVGRTSLAPKSTQGAPKRTAPEAALHRAPLSSPARRRKRANSKARVELLLLRPCENSHWIGSRGAKATREILACLSLALHCTYPQLERSYRNQPP